MSAAARRRRWATLLLAAAAPMLAPLAFGSGPVTPAAGFVVPAWAYPGNPPAHAAATVATDDGSILHVPDSRASYTRAQVKDLFAAPDWHPGDHAPMPGVVARGRRPSVYACACCHLPDGSGQRENASEAEIGEAAAYFLCRCPSRVAWRSSKQNACRSRCAIRGTGPSRTSRPTASHAGGRS